MGTQTNFSISSKEDCVITIAMKPPTAIGGWPIQWTLGKYFGSETDLVTKSVASGLNGTSGITVTNSGQGILNVQLNSVDTSGLDPGAYVYECDRLSSGRVTSLANGYLIITL